MSKGRVAANRYTSPDQPVGLERFAQEGKGAAAMPTYVSLISWTDQGVKNYRDTMARADAFRNLLRQAGGQVRELPWACCCKPPRRATFAPGPCGRWAPTRSAVPSAE